MNPQFIFSAFGIILIAFGALVLLPILVAVLEEDYSSALPFLTASLCSLTLGLFCRWQGRFSRNFDALKRTEGLLIVTLTWIVTAAMTLMPIIILKALMKNF